MRTTSEVIYLITFSRDDSYWSSDDQSQKASQILWPTVHVRIRMDKHCFEDSVKTLFPHEIIQWSIRYFKSRTFRTWSEEFCFIRSTQDRRLSFFLNDLSLLSRLFWFWIMKEWSLESWVAFSCACSKKSFISSINESDIRQYSYTRGHDSRDIQICIQ